MVHSRHEVGFTGAPDALGAVRVFRAALDRGEWWIDLTNPKHHTALRLELTDEGLQDILCALLERVGDIPSEHRSFRLAGALDAALGILTKKPLVRLEWDGEPIESGGGWSYRP